MSAAVFVDTNVLVYARDTRDGVKQAAAESLLKELWVEQTGRTSMQVLSEYYATVTHKLDPGLAPDEAWDDVTALFAWDPQPIDRELLARARAVEARHRLSWWDSMIVAAAQLQNCSLLVTEDLHHNLVCGTVVVRNPFVAGIAESGMQYPAEPRPRSRHRPRGRPRVTQRTAAQRS